MATTGRIPTVGRIPSLAAIPARVVLVSVAAILTFPVSEAAAQQEASEQQMAERECAAQLNRYVTAHGLQPDRDTYKMALRHCAAGLQRAFEAIRELDNKATMSPEECIAALERRGHWPPPRQAFGPVTAACKTGDLAGALDALKAAAVNRPSEKECESELGRYIARNRLQPSREAYNRALRYCLLGDSERALAILDEAPGDRRTRSPQDPRRESRDHRTPPAQVRDRTPMSAVGLPAQPPPPPRHERPAPRSGYIWAEGHWEWKDSTWDWRRGRWERPRSGYTWRPGSWELKGGRHVFVPGRWVENGGFGSSEVVPDPSPAADT